MAAYVAVSTAVGTLSTSPNGKRATFVEENTDEEEEEDDKRESKRISGKRSEMEAVPVVSLEEIGERLIREGFLLTALELHAEMCEVGRADEGKGLATFFSNPGNFEKSSPICASDFSPAAYTSTLPRTSSIQTFDSLDFARFSDDGDRQIEERVAVLEFELRKARETIKSLRANLTEAAESEVTTPDNHVCETDDPSIKLHEKRALNFLVNEYLLKHNYKLTSITFSDEIDDQDFEDWDDVGLNIPKPPPLVALYRDLAHHHHHHQANHLHQPPKKECSDVAIQVQLQEDHEEKPNTHHSSVSLKLETTDNWTQYDCVIDDSDNQSLGVQGMGTQECSEDAQQPEAPRALEEKPRFGQRVSRSDEFRERVSSLLTSSKLGRNVEDRLTHEVREAVDSPENVVPMLARCLPNIVPNVILAKREEMIPLILSAISLHPSTKVRDQLLNLLFNLIKRPDASQRHMILTGFVSIACRFGPTRVESEILPQCWEQINHRYMERRLLVAEACGVLIPHVASEIRSSLLLSMLRQMLAEEKCDEVRACAMESLAVLTAYVEDTDKFSPLLELTLRSILLVDDEASSGASSVGTVALRTLLPSMASWAKDLGRLEDHLVVRVLKELQERIVGETDGDLKSVVHLLKALRILLPWVFAVVVEALPPPLSYRSAETETSGPNITSLEAERFPSNDSPLCEISIIFGGELRAAALIASYDDCVSEEWYESWAQLDFVTKTLLPTLIGLVRSVDASCKGSSAVLPSFCNLFRQICRTFGQNFTASRVKPLFRGALGGSNPPENLSVLPVAEQSLAIPAYACGVLVAFTGPEELRELMDFFQELLSTVASCRMSLDGIQAAIEGLLANAHGRSYLSEAVIRVFWDGGIVHHSPLVRAATGQLLCSMVGVVEDELLASRVVPALITLANDTDQDVKASTVPAFGAIIQFSTNKELLAKSEMQLQSFLDDVCYRDQYELHVKIIRTFAQIVANSEPRFREEFVLPHLVALATNNNNRLNDVVRRTQVAIALVDAFNVLSCCYMGENVIAELFLPGLRCLLVDVQLLLPEQEHEILTLIQHCQSKVAQAAGASADSKSTPLSAVASSERSNSLTGVDEVRNRMSKIFNTKSPGGGVGVGKTNLQNLFQLRKK